jgi:hypothetical protein
VLQKSGEIGPGAVYRVVAETQRQFFDPPQTRTGVGKYR